MKTRTWLILLLSLALLLPADIARSAPNDLQSITPAALKARLGAKDLLVIDVRQPGDWGRSAAKIPGALRQNPQEAETWGPQLPRGRQIVLYCAWPHEATSARVARQLMGLGVPGVMVLTGGWNAWLEAGYPTEPKK
jgi:rhodanese-related sulfurtransferase